MNSLFSLALGGALGRRLRYELAAERLEGSRVQVSGDDAHVGLPEA